MDIHHIYVSLLSLSVSTSASVSRSASFSVHEASLQVSTILFNPFVSVNFARKRRFEASPVACEDRRFSSLITNEGRFTRRNVCDSTTEIPY